MPSVVENKVRWTEHSWDREGHEWSPGQTAAGGEMLWWRGLRPRVASHLPTGRVLEIGPGFGRWTQHLLGLCQHLTVVDLTERCIEHCRQRFAGAPNFEAWTNDGESLEMVPDGSIDFVFSFDSLVHAEAPVLRGYLRQLARKLKPGGTGFIHHSNLRAFGGESGELPSWLARRNWRAESMSARLFREYCAEASLHCRSQEVINWISRSRRADRHKIPGPGLPLTDAMSVFSRPASPIDDPTLVYLNPHFAEEWRQIIVLATLYGRRVTSTPAKASDTPVADRLERALRMARQSGLSGVFERLSERTTEARDFAATLARDTANARSVRRHEPILNAIKQHRCPDCGQQLVSDKRCSNCRVEFQV
jgi:SAM-dependent methyltransferase